MSADLGLDRSGNSNNWDVHNMAFSDQVLDTPSNNFCTLNPMASSNEDTYSQGNLKMVKVDNDTNSIHVGTISVSSGKWYWETQMTVDGGSNMCVGIAELGTGIDYLNANSNLGMSGSTGSYAYNPGQSGQKQHNNSQDSYGTAGAAGNIMGTALDLDAGTITFYKNNSTQGQAYTGISGTFTPATSGRQTGDAWSFNFGQDSSFAGVKTAQGNQDGNGIGDFYYAPPANHLALCTSNLPTPAVKPAEHFDTVLYTGNGGNKTISGFEFQPDFVWSGCRSAAQNMHIHTSVTGVEKRISMNTTDSEQSDGALKTFTSDGYTFDTAGSMNTSGESYINWCWELGSTAGSYPYGSTSHTQGTRDTTISLNSAAGQVWMYWTGAGSGPYTLGHGLSKAPELWMYRNINDVGSWNMSHIGTTNQFTKTLYPNANTGETTSVTCSAMSSTLITVPDGGATDSPNRLVAFGAHSVEGYSKIGHYIGNGSTNGTFVHCGFRPKFIWVKSMGGEPWMMMDSARGTYNEFDNAFNSGEAAAAETTNANHNIDFLSNGFKPRRNVGVLNTNGDRYAFYAIAETPFKYANAR